MSARKPSPQRAGKGQELRLEVFNQVRAEIWKMHSTQDLGALLQALQAGAAGYVLKDAGVGELEQAIRTGLVNPET